MPTGAHHIQVSDPTPLDLQDMDKTRHAYRKERTRVCVSGVTIINHEEGLYACKRFDNGHILRRDGQRK